jgi:hypothetical protein
LAKGGSPTASDSEVSSGWTWLWRLCELPVAQDGLAFEPDSVKAEEIREDNLHQGVRVTLLARLGKARVPIPVDIGFGDATSRNDSAMYGSGLSRLLPIPNLRCPQATAGRRALPPCAGWLKPSSGPWRGRINWGPRCFWALIPPIRSAFMVFPYTVRWLALFKRAFLRLRCCEWLPKRLRRRLGRGIWGASHRASLLTSSCYKPTRSKTFETRRRSGGWLRAAGSSIRTSNWRDSTVGLDSP